MNKVQVFGVKFQSGIAKKTGNPYKMATVTYLAPTADNVDNDTLQIRNYGLTIVDRVMSLPTDEDFKRFEQIASSQKFPCHGVLHSEEQFRGGNYVSALTGVTFDSANQKAS